ncbi:hypothetical protein C8F01DRAFT_1177444 [Mycena amicta]|nr:hypothetical protein C8F01DRAFT_1177444 [Mycena amicta]
MPRPAPAIPNSRPTAIALKAHQRLLGPQAAKYCACHPCLPYEISLSVFPVSAEHEYLEFKLTDTRRHRRSSPEERLPDHVPGPPLHCNVDLVQEASAEARCRLDAVAQHAQGSTQHFDALEAFFLASPAPALNELDDICRAADLARWAREAAL